jgi:2-dehydropantoate 2-reductase
MKIVVIGAGAIGGLVAGYLKLNGVDVTLLGHGESVKAISANGLKISGVRGNFNLKIDITEKLEGRPQLVILTTKTQDIPKALEDNLSLIKNSWLLTTQNGVQADSICARFIAQEFISSSIVMFGATNLKPGEVVHNFEGSWIIGSLFKKDEEALKGISKVLNNIFPVVVTDEISGMKYLKIFVNANNCIPAILGISMQEAFSDTAISSISIGIWKEGLEVVNKAGLKLVSLPDFPLERLTKLTSLPTGEAAKIFSNIMSNLSKQPLYGSILQSIKRGKLSEIDYINGEFVRIAQDNNISAALNKKLVDMVHQVEKTNKFFTKQELVNNTKGLFN